MTGVRSSGAKSIFSAKVGSPADTYLCSWPGCNAETNALPICWKHAREAHAIVQATYSAVMSQAMKQGGTTPTDRPGFVYFIRFSDRVKIGFSQDPDNRLRALPHDEVLGVFPGTRLNERQLHAAFADLRQTGEWFTLDDRILDFIADVKDQVA